MILIGEKIKELRKIDPKIDERIFKAYDNVNLNCALGYKKGNKKDFIFELMI